MKAFIIGIPRPDPQSMPLPLFEETVPAGFPSPAEGYSERGLDLNEHLVKHPAATFFVQVQGDSMTGAGIHSGDILIVDRSIDPLPGHVVIAVLDGQCLVKRLETRNGRLCLMAENPAYAPVEMGSGDLTIWGVVTHAIHAVKRI